MFGNGQYKTFDSKWYRFDGHCQYTLVEVSILNVCVYVYVYCVMFPSGMTNENVEVHLISHCVYMFVRTSMGSFPLKQRVCLVVMNF